MLLQTGHIVKENCTVDFLSKTIALHLTGGGGGVGTRPTFW